MNAMVNTTITITERTRRELLKIGAELQSKRGEKVDYEDVIEYLIGKARRNKELFLRATAVKGVSPIQLQRTLKEGREQDRRREEELEHRYS